MMTDLQVYDFGVVPNRWRKSLDIYKDGMKPPSKKQVTLCQLWLGEYATAARSKCCPKSSYFLKHLVEHECGEYISNGALIAAALSMGFEYTHNPGSINIGLYINLPKWAHGPIQGKN